MYKVNMALKELVEVAIDNLQNNLGIVSRWEEPGVDGLSGKLHLSIDNQIIRLNVLVRSELRSHQLPGITEQSSRYGNLMVVANNIFPKIKEELRKNKIAYLETNGNIWLQQNGTLLWIDTQKPVTVSKKTGNRAFTKTGLKVLLHFLLHERDINLPYRDIAALTGVGLGNVNYIITGLREMGFLLKLDKKQYKLINKKELLEKWMSAYSERLQPALKIGTFRFLHEEDLIHWKSLRLQHKKSWWGGEPAGELLTNFLRPAILTIYTTETRSDLIKNYRLIPDDNGNVRVYKKCWYDDGDNGNIAPPLLVYADLIIEGDRRCLETAQKIYDEFLQDRL
jgi:hypothetical protein